MTTTPAVETVTVPVTATRLDPRLLVLADNVRKDVVLDEAFKASVTERGVRTPIVVQRDGVGQWVVVDGQRRTLAALDAGLTDVPVVLVDDLADDSERIIEQLDVNHHRAGVSAADEAAAFDQLRLFGMSAAQIAKRTARPKEHVEAGFAFVQAPDHAREAMTEYGVDLVSAAQILEVADGDEEAVEALIETWDVEGPDAIAHALAQVELDKAKEQARAARVAELEAAGVTVLTETPSTWGQALARSVYSLCAAGDEDRTELDAAAHATCPGHAVEVTVTIPYGADEPRVSERAFCLDYRANGHAERWSQGTSTTAAKPSTPADAQAASAARKHVIASNKASDAAVKVRRKWITSLLKRSKMPSDAVQHAAAIIARYGSVQANTSALGDHADKVLDKIWPADKRRVLSTDTASKTEATRALLAHALAVGESALPRDFWRQPVVTTPYSLDGTRKSETSCGARHLLRLAAWGYPLADVEKQWLAGLNTDTDTTEATADTEATDDAARTRADDGATTAADTATEVGPTDTDPSAGDGEDDDAEDHDDLTVADGPHADDGATVTEQVEELVVSDPTNTEELDDDGDDAFDQAGECDRCGMALDADAVADGWCPSCDLD